MDARHAGADLRAILHHQGEGKGTGLGLSTVYGIVKQSGGQSGLQRARTGTTFKITSRARRKRAARRRAAHGQPPASGRNDARRRGPRPGARRMVPRVACARRIHRARGAPGGEALALAERYGAIDLVVTDVVMPRNGGPELGAALNRRAARSFGALHVGLHGRFRRSGTVSSRARSPSCKSRSRPKFLLRKVREALDVKAP